MYNFKLYKDWCDAALELDLELKSRSGGCIYMQDPATNTIIGREGNTEQRFFWMLWTPLNKLHTVYNDLPDWQFALETLKDNHGDFHIEAAKCHSAAESHYAWFPEINHKLSKDITKSDIIACVKRIRDFDNHGKHQTIASLRSA